MAESIYTRPEYREAIANEDLVWNAAFVPGLKESICGVAVLPFTPAMHLRLKIGGSPFVVAYRNRTTTRKDVALFLWQVSPKFKTGRFSELRRFLFLRSIRKLDFAALAREIEKYLDEAFQDAPPSKARGKNKFSIVVPYLHRLCPKYGTIEQILSRPYKQLFQLWNAARIERGETISTPSDTVRARLRAEINAAAKS